MPSNSPTLRDRYLADLRSGSTAVLATAVVVAVAAALAAAVADVTLEWGFLLLVLVGVQLPMAHERHWPRTAGWSRDVAWTLVAAAVVIGCFVAIALTAETLGLAPLWSAITAFLLATAVANLGSRWLAGRAAERR